jgi:regulator of cell morphogenesis and NO signaling
MQTLESIEQQRIGDIVAVNYHAAGVFREFGIDFCCGGGKTLAEVCEKKGLSVDQVRDKLNNISWNEQSPSEDFASWDASFLIDYIINTHHRFVRKKVAEIGFYAAKVASVHAESHPENIAIAEKFALLTTELMSHLEDEEESVFPMIKELSDKYERGQWFTEEEITTIGKFLDEMVDEHEHAGQLVADIRALSNNFSPPAEACATYSILYQNLEGFERDLHKHVHLENNILFRKVEKMLLHPN